MVQLPPEVSESLVRGGLLLDVDGAVATVTLNRPDKLNAQTPSLWTALGAVGQHLPDGVRVVVVRGAGRSFSAGIDLGMVNPDGLPGEESLVELLRQDEADTADRIGTWQEGFTWLRRPDIVSVAAVQGHAIGAGFQLALSCDVRIAAEDVSFCMKEPALGLVPDLTGTQPLVELVGYSRALEICASARRIGAEEALRIGLVNRVVAPERLDDAVREVVTALSAHPHAAVSATKQLLQGAAGRSLDEQRELERTAQVQRLRAMLGRD